MAGTVTMLLLAITNKSWLLGIGFLALFILFILRSYFAASPFICLGLFRHKNYSLVLAIAFLISGIGYSLAFLRPQLLTQVHHLAVQMVGYIMILAAAATAILKQTRPPSLTAIYISYSRFCMRSFLSAITFL
ncbi:hypothetical protein D3P08_20480 [Paenibacillus nanensis]|uniref:MFS transporter n=1 Tax=Paenibacillus nanensis TaxID=393251 RepID=A0A3A1UVC3_9BACL|nr:hypothetical protein [Paenibacillus nanensis]RIX50233.1 hypothetical protein D3P08_20480 [Paenibacillus nanensis]